MDGGGRLLRVATCRSSVGSTARLYEATQGLLLARAAGSRGSFAEGFRRRSNGCATCCPVTALRQVQVVPSVSALTGSRQGAFFHQIV